MSVTPLSSPCQGPAPCIVGRSSSHFTRVVRLFAHELGVACDFRVVPDLYATDAERYGGNPGLKLPNLVTADGVVFGALNSCRRLARLATTSPRIVWPEQATSLVAANAQELTLQAMATEVTWVLLQNDVESVYVRKLMRALLGMLEWLDAHVAQARSELPACDLSYFEAALFCLVEHLEFRNVMPLAPYPRLRAFAEQWGQRPSALATPFRFD